MKTLIGLILIVLSFLGILDATYITYEKLSGRIPPCNIYFKCGAVLESQWSSVGPVPLSVLGLIFYTIFFVLALRWYLGHTKVIISGRNFSFPFIFFIQGTVGALFSLYLLFIMGVVLQAWCLYCVFSAVICMSLFTTSVINYFLLTKEH